MKAASLLGLGLFGLFFALAYWGGAIQWDREPPYQLETRWGAQGSAPGEFKEPTGIAVSPEQIFVADARNRRIQVFNHQGELVEIWTSDKLQRPMNLSWRNGLLYVADFFADAVLVFDAQGRLQREIQAVDGLKNPGGVDAFADGSVLVADTYHHRIVKLDIDGQILASWGESGQKGSRAEQFNYPTDVAIRADGGFYVADGYNDRVQQFDPAGRFIRMWGGPFGRNIHGPFKGWFATASSVAIDPTDGSVLVADFYHDRVQKFCDRGGYLSSFTVSSTNRLTHAAMAVDVDTHGRVWVANFGQHTFEVWRSAMVQ